jgi:integrase
MASKRGKKWTASGYDRTTGKKRHLSTHATKKEADRAEAEWKLRSRPTGRETCDSFADGWMERYPRPRESTIRTHHEHTRRFSVDFRGVKLADVDRPTARAWAMNHRSDLPAVRAMFGDALRDGLVDLNPFAALRIPKSRGRKDLIALTELELVDLANVALDPRMELEDYAPQLRAMILFSGYVGCRPGELFALRREDVRGQLVTIERSYDSHAHKITPPKNGKPRTVTVPPPAQDALLDVPEHSSGLLFVAPAGGQWTASLHHRYWTRLRLIANRPKLQAYELRHAAATFLLERGATPLDAAHQLGHTDGGRLIVSLYGHPSEAGTRSRLLAVWDEDVQPLRAVEHRKEETA